ncbi:hypothetical protein [Methyloferula stellata]|uniref:hypothetical protein n=1 Tax=Methyloferula stellata TaxID=876270 RepID=UPI00036DF7D1|nr:hypothetical protein [Methyloferula stellata]
MADEPNTPKIVESIPSIQGGISAIASGNAPFVYFDAAPFYGHLNGIGQVTLEAARLFGASEDGKAIIDRVIVGHLRGNLLAIKSLRAALDGIILMAEPVPEGPAN